MLVGLKLFSQPTEVKVSGAIVETDSSSQTHCHMPVLKPRL